MLEGSSGDHLVQSLFLKAVSDEVLSGLSPVDHVCLANTEHSTPDVHSPVVPRGKIASLYPLAVLCLKQPEKLLVIGHIAGCPLGPEGPCLQLLSSLVIPRMHCCIALFYFGAGLSISLR